MTEQEPTFEPDKDELLFDRLTRGGVIGAIFEEAAEEMRRRGISPSEPTEVDAPEDTRG